MKKNEAIQLILDRFPQAYIVSTCGHISRDLYNLQDRSKNFYMLGSMGMAAPVALGLSLVQPNKQFIILDGDGSFLMNQGIIAMIGYHQPPNLIHVILDNGLHESTGGQKTIPLVNITQIALQVGYRFGIEVISHEDWEQEIPIEGPILVHMRIEPRSKNVGRRVHWTPQQIVSRFTSTLYKQGDWLV